MTYTTTDDFVKQLDTLSTEGSILERSQAISALKRLMSKIDDAIIADVYTTYLIPDSTSKYGYKGIASTDEYVECYIGNDAKCVSMLARAHDKNKTVVAGLALKLSPKLAEDIFGFTKEKVTFATGKTKPDPKPVAPTVQPVIPAHKPVIQIQPPISTPVETHSHPTISKAPDTQELEVIANDTEDQTQEISSNDSFQYQQSKKHKR